MSIQARRDRALREELLGLREVKKAIDKVREATSGYGFGSRRGLLTGALRLTRSMSPEVADALQHSKRRLGFERPVEVFVRPDPLLNACCMAPASGPAVIVLSSRLMEVFTPAELCFVIGHEVAHLKLDHFAIPMPLTATIEDVAGTLVSRQTALKLYVWCRAAEISADRAGLICAEDPTAAASGFFKLASGLSSPRVKADLEAYATQVESLASTPEARAKPRDDDDTLDCFSTHPYSPLRVRSVVAFSKSKSYLKLIGRSAADGLSDEEVEAIVERDLTLMEPSYLEEKTAQSELMRRILYTGGVLVAAANGEIVKSEIDSLRSLLGGDTVSDKLDVVASRKELEQKLDEARSVPLAARAQLVQHLTIVAAADGSVEPSEIDEIERIAARLEVPATIIHQAIAGAAWPMD